jgi:hypothetical protein
VPDWTHPDELDRVAAPGNRSSAPSQASSAEVADALTRAFATGGLRRIPKNTGRRDIMLAILCLNLRRRQAYSELEINQHLKEVLRTMNAQVDHVTCRRYLVELGFVRRDRAGARYILNHPRLEATLSPDAASSAEALLHGALARHARKQLD